MRTHGLVCTFVAHAFKNVLNNEDRQRCSIMRKSEFCICENKGAYQLHSNYAADQRLFVFATYVVQSLYFLKPKFHTSIYLPWLHSPVCV